MSSSTDSCEWGTGAHTAPLQLHRRAGPALVGSAHSSRRPLDGSSVRPVVAMGGAAGHRCQLLPSQRHALMPTPLGGVSGLTNSSARDTGSNAISPAIGVVGRSPPVRRNQVLPFQVHVSPPVPVVPGVTRTSERAASSQAINAPSIAEGPWRPESSSRHPVPFHAHVSLRSAPDSSRPPKSITSSVDGSYAAAA